MKEKKTKIIGRNQCMDYVSLINTYLYVSLSHTRACNYVYIHIYIPHIYIYVFAYARKETIPCTTIYGLRRKR